MSYYIKGSEVDALYIWTEQYVADMNKGLGLVAESLERFLSLPRFQGETALSVQSYIAQVHLPMIQSIYLASEELRIRYAEYMNPYFNDIDTQKNCEFDADSITTAKTHFSSSRSDFADKHDSLISVLNSISDIIALSKPSVYPLDCALFDAASVAKDLDQRVSEHEDTHAARAALLNDTLEPLYSLITTYKTSPTKGGVGYTPDSVLENPNFKSLIVACDASATYSEKMGDYLSKAHEALVARVEERQKEYEEEMARQLEEEGKMQIVAAGLTIAAGGLLCLFTFGAAAPAVVAVGTVVLAGSTAFQVSEMVEGANKIYLAKTGDITSKAYNPMRDNVFGGNQKAYDAASSILDFSVGLIAPASLGVNAFKAAEKAAGKAVGKTVSRNALKEAGKKAAKEVGKDILKDVVVDNVILTPIAYLRYGDTKKAEYFKKAAGAIADSVGSAMSGGAGSGSSTTTHNSSRPARDIDFPDSSRPKNGLDIPSKTSHSSADDITLPKSNGTPDAAAHTTGDTSSNTRPTETASVAESTDTASSHRSESTETSHTDSADTRHSEKPDTTTTDATQGEKTDTVHSEKADTTTDTVQGEKSDTVDSLGQDGTRGDASSDGSDVSKPDTQESVQKGDSDNNGTEDGTATKEDDNSSPSEDKRNYVLKGKGYSVEDFMKKHPEFADNDVLNKVSSGETTLTTAKEKGNFVEMFSDAYYSSQGYDRINSDSITSLDDPIHQGIDGIYYKKDGDPPFIICESGYAGDGQYHLNTLEDGTKQMSKTWISARLEKALGTNKPHLNEIRELLETPGLNKVGSRVVMVDNALNAWEFELDFNATKTRVIPFGHSE